MVLLGAELQTRNTEQHDIFFGIGSELKDLLHDMIEFWPEAGKKLHIDGWREVTVVNGFRISVINRDSKNEAVNADARLFFINLGGYKENEFEEYHYKIIVAAKEKGEAIQMAKKTAFYQHTGFKGADSHIDDKFGVDVDDIYEIKDILPPKLKQLYSITLEPSTNDKEDEIHLGYVKLSKLSQDGPSPI